MTEEQFEKYSKLKNAKEGLESILTFIDDTNNVGIKHWNSSMKDYAWASVFDDKLTKQFKILVNQRLLEIKNEITEI